MVKKIISFSILLTAAAILLLHNQNKTLVQINATDYAVLTKPTTSEKEDIIWKQYVSTKYNFKVEYPSSWYMHEYDTFGISAVVFYPNVIDKSDLIDAYRENATLFAVYPKGYPADGFSYTSTNFKSSPIENLQEERDYILETDNTSVFMKMFFINDKIENWSNGFILARLKVDKLNQKCVTKPDPSECDISAGDIYKTYGTISEENYRDTIEHIINSFEFIN